MQHNVAVVNPGPLVTQVAGPWVIYHKELFAFAEVAAVMWEAVFSALKATRVVGEGVEPYQHLAPVIPSERKRASDWQSCLDYS